MTDIAVALMNEIEELSCAQESLDKARLYFDAIIYAERRIDDLNQEIESCRNFISGMETNLRILHSDIVNLEFNKQYKEDGNA